MAVTPYGVIADEAALRAVIGWPNDAYAKTPITGIEDTRALFKKLVMERRQAGLDKAPRD